jgi:hypothetical protein
MFYRFSELPAELRANIWSLSLHNDYRVLFGCSRFIEIHAYNTDLEEFSIAITRRYPTVYHVTRESRYEAAKLEGCEFVTLQGRHWSKYTTASTTGVELCVNFARDTFLISKRFTEHDIETLLPSPYSSAEEAHLTHFAQIFPAPVRAKIERNHLVAMERGYYDASLWYGRPLNLFTGLKRIRILAETLRVHLRLRVSLSVGLRKMWKDMGGAVPVPEVAFEIELEDCDWLERMLDELRREHLGKGEDEWEWEYTPPREVSAHYDANGIMRAYCIEDRW